MAKKLTLEEQINLVKVYRNIASGTADASDNATFAEYFLHVPRNVIEELKENIEWSNIIAHDFGDGGNELVGEMVFSLKENKHRFLYREQYLNFIVAREYRVPNNVYHKVINDNLPSEIPWLFTAEKERISDVLTVYLSACERNKSNPNWVAISSIENLPIHFIAHEKDNLDWTILSIRHEKTEEFMFCFYKYIDIEEIERMLNY